MSTGQAYAEACLAIQRVRAVGLRAFLACGRDQAFLPPPGGDLWETGLEPFALVKTVGLLPSFDRFLPGMTTPRPGGAATTSDAG